MRNLTKTLAVVSLLAPASGHTLGIGDIKLHSSLNQNLDAEIALTLSGESVSDIKVNLAPPGKFDEAGVSWSYFLSKIKLETVTHPNGATVIKVTSKEALKEPFLDFLLEVSWPKGNLYREFTVLVDPPSVY
ncbi:MAG: type IV pilus assembly protein FimV, partial [Methylobacter sp.]